MSNEHEPVTSIVTFDELKATIATYKEKNNEIIESFDYETVAGERVVRSYAQNLRKVKGLVTTKHREDKSYFLQQGRLVDDDKNFCLTELDGMITTVMEPLKIKEERITAELQEAAVAKLVEEKRIEDERLAAIKEQEDKLAAREQAIQEQHNAMVAREHAIKVEQDKLQAAKDAELDKQVALDRAEEQRLEDIAKAEADKMAMAEQVEFDKQQALKKAEQQRLEAIETAKQKAKADEQVKIIAEQNRLAKEKAEQDRFDQIEADRIADKIHRHKIECGIYHHIHDLIGDDDDTECITQAIVEGRIDNVTINY